MLHHSEKFLKNEGKYLKFFNFSSKELFVLQSWNRVDILFFLDFYLSFLFQRTDINIIFCNFVIPLYFAFNKSWVCATKKENFSHENFSIESLETKAMNFDLVLYYVLHAYVSFSQTFCLYTFIKRTINYHDFSISRQSSAICFTLHKTN